MPSVGSHKTLLFKISSVCDTEIGIEITSRDGTYLKQVQNFKYLGSWMKNTESDKKHRKALAWNACHKVRQIWISKISKKIKTNLFVSTVESVLLYGSETSEDDMSWSLFS